MRASIEAGIHLHENGKINRRAVPESGFITRHNGQSSFPITSEQLLATMNSADATEPPKGHIQDPYTGLSEDPHAPVVPIVKHEILRVSFKNSTKGESLTLKVTHHGSPSERRIHT